MGGARLRAGRAACAAVASGEGDMRVGSEGEEVCRDESVGERGGWQKGELLSTGRHCGRL